MIFGVSQIVKIRKITTMISITTGWKTIRIVDPKATTSSIRLSATFETGSGLAFAASLVAAFVPWELSAIPPPRIMAAIFTAGSKSAKAVAARIAPAGTRMNVWIASQAVSTAGILSATNSITYSAAASDIRRQSPSMSNPPGSLTSWNFCRTPSVTTVA
jgi:hypothetical protein